MKVSVVGPNEHSAEKRRVWDRLQASSDVVHSLFYINEFTLAVGEAFGDVQGAVIGLDGAIAGSLPHQRAAAGVAKPIGGPISDNQGPFIGFEAKISPEPLLRLAGPATCDLNHLPVAVPAFARQTFQRSASPRCGMIGFRDRAARAMTSVTQMCEKRSDRSCRAMRHDPLADTPVSQALKTCIRKGTAVCRTKEVRCGDE